MRERLFHVTVLSNFARGYDKYAGRYDKTPIAESTFPDRFFLLRGGELPIGIAKASRLLAKSALPGDRLIVLETDMESAELRGDHPSGLGRYVLDTDIRLHALYLLDGETLVPVAVEDLYAESLAVLHPRLLPYEALGPRTVSVLPIARACQAACRFCFSESSVSRDRLPQPIPLDLVDRICEEGAAKGARRFVVTGGGEPGLLLHIDLLRLIAAGKRHLPKAILITNGMHLAKLADDARCQRLNDYQTVGLDVLAISRHHHCADINATIMGIDTKTEAVLASQPARHGLRTRLICVLQKEGVASASDIAAYLDWATTYAVDEICFKELYVSTMRESAYAEQPENAWSRAHQVPLALLVAFLENHGFAETDALPWGSPIYAGTWNGRPIQIAAYTEPSLFWERTHGIARSWNLMTDGACLASLEDPHSRLPFAEPVPA